MFDRNFHITDRSGPSHVTVTEKRAPTDESVRLLKELEKAAQDKIVQSIRLENSPIDCVVHTQQNPMNAQRDFCVLVRINGKKLEIRRSFNEWATLDDVAKGLRTAVSERIAAEILAPAFGKLNGQLRF